MAPRLLSLALWAVPCCGASVEDTSVMVQSRKAASLGLDLDHEKDVPDFGTGGVRMTRISASGESGATFKLVMPPYCDEGDEFGPKECSVHWGQVLNSTFNVHLKDGINPGDVLSSSYRIDTQSFNKSSFLGFLVPKHLYANSTCQFCEGLCVMHANVSAYIVHTSSPTNADNETICAREKKEDLIIDISESSIVSKPAPDLAYVGNATVGIHIKDRDGAVRVEGAYRFSVGPNASEREAAVTELTSASEGQRPMTLVELVRDTMESTVANALAALGMDSFPPELNLMRTEAPEVSVDAPVTGPMHVFVLNITLRDVQYSTGSNLSVWYDEGCEKLDDWGSIACRVPLGKLVNSTVTAGVWIVSEEGSTIRQKSKVSVGGTLGILLSAMLEETEYTVPLCGHEKTTVIVNGAPKEVYPAKCGSYTFDVQTVMPQPNKYMDFGNIDLPKIESFPYLPRKVDQLMPILFHQEFELKHHDNSSIAFLSVVMGLDKV